MNKNHALVSFFAVLTIWSLLQCIDYAQPKNASNPCPIDADIWVLAGQSNMQGAGRTPDTSTNPKIMMLNMDNTWMVAQNPVHRIFESSAYAYERCFYELLPDTLRDWEKVQQQFKILCGMSKKNPIGGIGPGSYFAKHIFEQTGRPIALIPCALGGSTIAQWDPEKKQLGDSSLYGATINRIKSVGGKIKGILWWQGESEAMSFKTKDYESKFLKLIDSFRTDIGDNDLPVIYVQIALFNVNHPDKDIAWEQIRETQRTVLSKRKNAYMVSAFGLPLDDCVHISSEGQKVMGTRMAEIALTYVYQQTGHAKQINLESVKLQKDERSGSSYLHLHYSGVCGKLKSSGLPSEFQLRLNGKLDQSFVVSKVVLDPDDNAGINVYLSGVPNEPAQLISGAGTYPYMNITDSLDNAIPAFGPIDIPIK